MSAFRFRLETLLRLRLAERDQRRADLAKALRAEDLLRQQQAQLEAEGEQIQAQARQRSAPGAADVDALLAAHRYRLVLKSRRQQVAQQMSQVAAEAERRRQVLVEADRQVRVLQKLRERKQAAHQVQELRAEVKLLDEAGSIQHARRAGVRS